MRTANAAVTIGISIATLSVRVEPSVSLGAATETIDDYGFGPG
jgi:hypothetical protein